MSIISQSVAHLKSESVERAKQEAQKIISEVKADLDAANWNVDETKGAMLVIENSFGRKQKKYTDRAKLINAISTHAAATKKPSEPLYRKPSQEAEQRFIDAAANNAAAQYDAFVAKLENKIGEVKSATLEGNHVWGYSFLTVETIEGEKQTWKTQMIVNCSKLGNLFNQFPTRKVKNA